MLKQRIREFLERPQAGDFEELAREALGGESWRDVAPTPPTSGEAADPELRRAAVAAVLPATLLASSDRQPVLVVAEEGLSRLTDEILALRGDSASERPIGPRGVEAARVRSWLAARQRGGAAVLLVGTPERLEQLLTPIERRGLRFRLPPGSTVVAVRADASAAPGLAERLGETLGVTADRLLIAWETEGVATPFFAAWREPVRFAPPGWTRVEARDGELAVFDLANLGRALKVATGVRGEVDGASFRFGR